MNKNRKVEVIKYVDGFERIYYFERHENILAVSDVDHGEKYKLFCESCPKFGKNLACPPHSPSYLQYINEVETAKVICIRLPTEYFARQTGEEKYRSCFRMAGSLLARELLTYREEGYSIAGSGTCLACEICAVEKGDTRCKKPKKRIYSLESLGVNVIALVKRCFGIDLDWNDNEYTADFVSAVGAVFYDKKLPRVIEYEK